jgi:hypothetical protein
MNFSTRAERMGAEARHSAGISAVFLTASLAAGVWAVRAWQSEASGGVLALALAFAALSRAETHGREALRVARLARIERRWERAKRPEIRL